MPLRYSESDEMVCAHQKNLRAETKPRKIVDDEGEMAYGWAKRREPGGARTSPQDGSTAIDGNYESSNPWEQEHEERATP